MKTLTQEQKAKRYEWFEKTILEYLDNIIESDYEMNGEDSDLIDVVDTWMENIDKNDNIIPKGVYMLLDKICDEQFYTFISLKKCKHEPTVKAYREFEKAIGEK